mmetsp:Transcript_51064/g.136567  ORF Transcript_51064/g.136567 Transcript_51064/m.136567 type:complete len:203 (-) Transcript_51064:95-703(-)
MRLVCISTTTTFLGSRSKSSRGSRESGRMSVHAALIPYCAKKKARLTFPARERPIRRTSAFFQSFWLSPSKCCCAYCTASTLAKNSSSTMSLLGRTAPPGIPLASASKKSPIELSRGLMTSMYLTPIWLLISLNRSSSRGSTSVAKTSALGPAELTSSTMVSICSAVRTLARMRTAGFKERNWTSNLEMRSCAVSPVLSEST